MKSKLSKLDTKGLAHFILPLAVLVLVAAAGTYALVASHADPVVRCNPDRQCKSKAKLGTIKVRVVTARCKVKVVSFDKSCKYVNSRDNLLIYIPLAYSLYETPVGTKCNNTSIPVNGNSVAFGTTRTFRCEPGEYDLTAERAHEYTYRINAQKIATVDVKAGKTTSVVVGSTFDLNH